MQQSEIFIFSPIQMIILIISVVSSLLLAVGIYRLQRKSQAHTSLFYLLIFLSLACFFRAMGWISDLYIFYRLSYICYLAIPISMTIFIEKSIQRNLHQLTKLILVGGALLLLPVLLFQNNEPETWWKWTYLSYLLFMVGIMVSTPLLELKNNGCKNERSILITICTSSCISLFFVILDLLSMHYTNLNLRLSSLAILVFNYFLASILFSTGSFSFRSYLIKISQYLFVGWLVSTMSAIAISNLSIEKAYDIWMITFSSLIPVYIFDKVFSLSFNINNGNILQRLNNLSKSNTENMLKDFHAWDEVKKVHLLNNDFLKNRELSFLFLLANESIPENFVYDQFFIKNKLDQNPSIELKNHLQAVDYILRFTKTEYLIIIPEQQCLIVASFSYMMNANYFRDVLMYLSREICLFEKHNKALEVNYV